MADACLQNGVSYNYGFSNNNYSYTGNYGYNSGYSSVFSTEWLEKQEEYSQKKESIQINETTDDLVLTDSIDKILSYIKNGEEDKALKAYDQLLNDMKSQARYAGTWTKGEGNGDNVKDNDRNLRVIAKQLIESRLDDEEGLEAFIRKNTADASGKSWQKTFFNNNKVDEYTQEDLLKEILLLDEEKNVSVGQYILEGICTITVKPFTELGDLLGIFGKHH